MKIITRYMLKQYLPVFALTIVTFVGIYLIIDFFEKVDNMLSKGMPATDIISYFACKIPFIITQGLPAATLLGTLIALGMLKRNHELIAMEASGIHRITYVKPIIIVALFFSVAHFLFAESVARTLNQRSEAIWQETSHNTQSMAFGHMNIWYHGKGVIYQIRLYDPENQAMEKPSLYLFNEHFNLTGRIDAARIVWDGEGWVARKGLELKFTDRGIQQEQFDEKRLKLHELPGDFGKLQTMPEELNWIQLHRYSSKIRGEGFNSLPYEVELHLRVAYPFTTFIFALLAVTIALRHRIHGGIAANVAVAFIITTVYLAALNMGSGLATAGVLGPALGVWTGNVIFCAVLLYMWITNT